MGTKPYCTKKYSFSRSSYDRLTSSPATIALKAVTCTNHCPFSCTRSHLRPGTQVLTHELDIFHATGKTRVPQRQAWPAGHRVRLHHSMQLCHNARPVHRQIPGTSKHAACCPSMQQRCKLVERAPCAGWLQVIAMPDSLLHLPCIFTYSDWLAGQQLRLIPLVIEHVHQGNQHSHWLALLVGRSTGARLRQLCKHSRGQVRRPLAG